MKKVILIATFFFSIVFAENTLHAQWVQQVSNVNHVLNSVHCVNDTVCYTVGDYGERLNTNNGGNTWNNLKWFGDNDLSSVYVFNYSLAFAAGYLSIVEFANNGNTQYWGSASCLKFGRGIYCINDTTGYAVGDSGVIVRNDSIYTLHGDWYCLNSITNFNLYSVHFPSDSIGYVVGDSGTIIKTIDGGNNWVQKNAGIVTNFRSVNFINDSIGFVVGHNGVILKTQDGGNSWIVKQSNINNNLNSVYFPSDSVGYIAGDGGVILKTNDAGNTWMAQSTGVSYNLKSVYFTNNSIGYAVGAFGTILKTDNGGAVGIADSHVKKGDTIVVYPNPSNGSFTVDFEQAMNVSEIRLTDLLGNIILKQFPIGQTEFRIDNLPGGVYILSVIDKDNRISNKKIISCP